MNFKSFALFNIKNVDSGYTLYHLENCFFLFYVYFKIVIPKSIAQINYNIEKNTTLNAKGQKRRTKN